MARKMTAEEVRAVCAEVNASGRGFVQWHKAGTGRFTEPREITRIIVAADGVWVYFWVIPTPERPDTRRRVKINKVHRVWAAQA